MEYQVLKGTHDVIKDEAFSYTSIENFLCAFAQNYSFEEFRIPVIEKSELFLRSVGESSDVVRKEMYEFLDKGGRKITLRPEFTAGILRSMVNAKLFSNGDYPVKAYYVGPVFRYDRPQQGRFRQFNQFGVESVGSDSYLRDCEVISFGYNALLMLGFKDVKLKINTLGDEESRKQYRMALEQFFLSHVNNMCDDCKERFKLNPLRILDCKVSKDQEIVKDAPKIEEYLSDNSKTRFSNLCAMLDSLNIKYEIDKTLVRGLDYYSETVFEYHYTSSIGNNYGAIGAGGHYSNLVSELGGPKIPGVGLSFGIERLFNILNDDGKLNKKNGTDLFIMPLTKNDSYIRKVFELSNVLRLNGYSCEIACEPSSISSMFKKAERRNSKFALIVGDDEITNNAVNIKNLASKEQEQVKIESLIDYLDKNIIEKEEHNYERGHE